MSEGAPGSIGFRRSWHSLAVERAIEALITVCGISAVILVGGIFFFVFREAFPVLASPNFSLGEFLFSVEWYPTSVTDVRYGVLAMIVGTLAVTALAMAIAVPFGIGGAIYLSEFCGPKMRETLEGRHRTPRGDSVGGVGLHRPHRREPAADHGVRRGSGPERAQRGPPARVDEPADHRVDRRGRAQGRARLVP